MHNRSSTIRNTTVICDTTTPPTSSPPSRRRPEEGSRAATATATATVELYLLMDNDATTCDCLVHALTDLRNYVNLDGMSELRQAGSDLRDLYAELEARVARLEADAVATSRGQGGGPPNQAPQRGDRFWALNALRSRLDHGKGAVLFCGAVPLPAGEEYEWQYGRDAAELLDQDWSQLSPVIAALAHPVRLRLLRQILTGTHAVADLGEVERLGTSGQLYHHLRILASAGWLTQAARGRYSVPPGRVVPLLVVLAAVGPP